MRHWIFIFCFMMPICAWSAETFGPYHAQVVRVIDGDTIELDVALWPGLRTRTHLRLNGIDTPELRSRQVCERTLAERAANFVRRFVSQGNITVKKVHLGKFANRVIGHLEVDGRDLGDTLLAEGLARNYQGGKRESWCSD